MRECIYGKVIVPQWYVLVNQRNAIIAGADVIENNFHERKDLRPKLCALFVEKDYRN